MRYRGGTVAGQWKASLFVVLLVFGGCRTWKPSSTPTVTINTVPAADAGGRDKLATIEGGVTGAKPGQQIVLYVKSGELWWVQPFTDRPFTKILGDSSWKSQTHLGSEYAALLVDSGYTASDTRETLPSLGAGVVATAVRKGIGPAPAQMSPKTIHFSGYDWTAAEIKLTRSLGYGTYVFVVHDVSHLEPSAVLSLFTWDELGTEQNRRELDIEVSGWGRNEGHNTHYVVQPYYVPTNVVRFHAPA